ncbi:MULTISPECIES: chromosome partitioning protein ParB [Sphingomonadaceae]|jgi:hypothetical protein|uniref:Chromosome partitioning protein ParB n=1 Tax=Sphingobium yanoikuyae TaxID=13690 RepID=A0A3G2UMX3_SPHYA|nr:MULTISPECIES: chromosome partitioning protein ParB [Sphingomonadaceae]RSU73027.1 chromosome partitioning protein ParB [Sphingomonas sp. S-NIH.Pt3_0716]HEV7436418.1 chromosome partitioning protein ParB [Pseudorhizobium sp.]AYO75458.1 chromosome partitioning protein ParB [Sphingobium yanoikuyae]MBP8234929.1 chromosome partitioning protein ParB [Rhizorhabdus sp.]MDG2515025.1 chromosome partitioning protein ParB [Sphingobium yanoikuyae]
MTEKPSFAIDIGGLKTRPKPQDASALRAADEAAEEHGFVSRDPEPRKAGRRPSPRTGQVHAKVLPHVALEIADEAQRRGVTQGVLIEEAWALFTKDR